MRINARTICFVLSSIVSLPLSGCGSSRSGAEQSSDAVTIALGGDQYQSGIPTDRLQFTAAPDTWGRQRSSNWCWAADLQTILDFHGLPVTQEQVVQRAYGSLLDRPASPEEIAAAVDGWTMQASDGQAAVVQAASVPFDVGAIVREMHSDRPSIIGLVTPGGSGHAYVLTSITYRSDGNLVQPVSVTLRDPWPDNPNFKTMSYDEMTSLFIGLVFIDVRR
jgi:hypothetical protein